MGQAGVRTGNDRRPDRRGRPALPHPHPDFRIHYVFSYSDLSLPTRYLISTMWAGQEGSFLLWLMWGMIVGLPLIRYAQHYEDRTLIVYNVAQLSLLLLLLRQSPFRLLADLPPGQVPTDGQGLNPLLQNPWMTIHPPIMFIGYAATAIPFAFAIAALWGRRYDEWVTASMPWALVTVVTLGCAILLGGYWAYVTLGWGGYWGWDPVENSSLVPWIASPPSCTEWSCRGRGAASGKLNFSPRHPGLRAGGVRDVSDALRRAGRLLCALVRGPGITGWLVANLAGALSSVSGCLRGAGGRFRPSPATSRCFEDRLLRACDRRTSGHRRNGHLGTSAPLITRLATKPSQVGPAFYNRVTLPIGILLATLLGVVPYLHWKGTSKDFAKRLGLAAALAAVATGAGVILGARGVLYVAFLLVSLFAFFSNATKTWLEARAKRFRVAGGYLAHVGLGLMLAGIITSSAYDRTQKVVLTLNESKQVLGYTLTFKGVDKPTPTAREAMLVEVREEGGGVTSLAPHVPEREVEPTRRQPWT
jgi:cytochrome c-type biogenesis protein CcmF